MAATDLVKQLDSREGRKDSGGKKKKSWKEKGKRLYRLEYKETQIAIKKAKSIMEELGLECPKLLNRLVKSLVLGGGFNLYGKEGPAMRMLEKLTTTQKEIVRKLLDKLVEIKGGRFSEDWEYFETKSGVREYRDKWHADSCSPEEEERRKGWYKSLMIGRTSWTPEKMVELMEKIIEDDESDPMSQTLHWRLIEMTRGGAKIDAELQKKIWAGKGKGEKKETSNRNKKTTYAWGKRSRRIRTQKEAKETKEKSRTKQKAKGRKEKRRKETSEKEKVAKEEKAIERRKNVKRKKRHGEKEKATKRGAGKKVKKTDEIRLMKRDGKRGLSKRQESRTHEAAETKKTGEKREGERRRKKKRGRMKKRSRKRKKRRGKGGVRSEVHPAPQGRRGAGEEKDRKGKKR